MSKKAQGSFFERARESYEKEDFPQALQLYRRALDQANDNKNRAAISAEQGWTLYKMDEYEQAVEAMENVLKFDPQYEAKEDIHRIKGFCYIALQDDANAADALKQSLALDSDSEKQQITRFELGKLLFKKQDYTGAQTLFNEIESYFFQSNREYWLSVLFYQGFILYYRGEFEKSEHVFEELLENARDESHRSTALFGLSFITFKKQDYLKTINLCESIVAKNENFFDMEAIGFLTAASFHYLGRDDVFEKYYDQLIIKYPQGRYYSDLEKIKKEIKI